MTKLDSSKRIHTVRVRGGNIKHRALRLDTGNFAWGSESITRKTRLIQVVSRTFQASRHYSKGTRGYRSRCWGFKESSGGCCICDQAWRTGVTAAQDKDRNGPITTATASLLYQVLITDQQRYNASNNELLRTQTLVKSAVVDIDATPFRQWYEAHYAQPAARGAKLAAPAEGEETKQSNHVKRVLEERKKTAKLDPILEQQFKAGRLLAIITSRPGQSGRADGYILEGKELDFYHRKLQAKKSKHAA